MMNDVTLGFKRVGKDYTAQDGSQVTALEDISFEVKPGEFISLIGSSGCGKSTLLYIAGGFTEKSSGSVELFGKEVDGPGPERGMVFQHYSLFPWLTVRENVQFSFRLRKFEKTYRYKPVSDSLSRIEYADHLLDFMGLSQFAHHYPRQLSGGMQQRVAIARTLAARPAILLMDEPFSALDAQTREEMQEMLLLLAKHTQITVMFVTHDVEEAIYLSDRVVVLSKRPGTILETKEIDLPGRPDLEIKNSSEFHELKVHFTQLIRSQSQSFFSKEALMATLDSQPK